MGKLYSAEQYIKNLNSFKNYINKMKPSDDFNKAKDKLIDAVKMLKYYIADLELSTKYKDCYKQHNSLLETFQNTINNSETLDDLSIIIPLLELLDANKFNEIRHYDLKSSADDLQYKYIDGFRLPTDYLNTLRASISNEKLNIFHPDCYNGTVASNFANDSDLTYGQLDGNSSRAREMLHRVIRGPLKGSFISNNFFDVLMLLPNIGYEEKKDPMGTPIEPEERIIIKNTIKYLRPGGVMIITLPYTRLMPNIALYLSKALSNVEVIKVPDDEMKRITIIGNKNLKASQSDNDIYQKLRLFDYESALDISQLNSNYYSIPTEELILEYFRGSKLDIADVLEASNDNMIESFLINQTQPLVVKDQSPLLPFNIGQVGLVLTSGCLDGVIKEMDGINHVIKGMTTKITTKTTEDLADNKVKSTETISNQVKINVFTANGEFIQLG
jgi:hypothetical protein